MTDLKLHDVTLVLVDHRRQVRNSLRMALNEAGLQNHNILDGPDVETITDALHNSVQADVLICDADMQNGKVLNMFHAIRHAEIGQNPFLGIIAVSWRPTETLVNSVADAGADFLLAAPFSPQQIFDRINSLVHNRLPFVVTSDYVGPDRRFRARGASAVPQIDVPNSLRQKVYGEYDPLRFRLAVNDSIGNINTQKMERQAQSVAHHAELIVVQFERQPRGVDTALLDRLQASASDLKWRAGDAGLSPISDLCEALENVVRRIGKAAEHVPPKEIELLKQLAIAIRRSFTIEGQTVGMVRDIATAVSSRR